MRSLEWADPAGTPPPPVFLHDSRITEVRCEKNAVTFCFADGFSLVENGQLTRAVRGFVTFSDCPAVGLFRLARHWASVPLRLAAAWEGDTARSAGPGAFSPVTVLSSSSPRCIPPTACTGAAYSISRKSAFGRERTPISSSRPWAVTR